ncbi:WhiB family transcriptional regulator [Nonomuraea sp. 10N515B]|uniref:WhiB family transcriptional regulator n=1 Tax=Nonomuraea sp. 10N515B TaxID=3457422 RepID=UPI003FCE2D72
MATATSWMSWGLCAEVDPEVFFPERGESPRRAKVICAGCPVRQECLDYALAEEIQFGVWGGLTLLERRRFRRVHAAAGQVPGVAGRTAFTLLRSSHGPHRA